MPIVGYNCLRRTMSLGVRHDSRAINILFFAPAFFGKTGGEVYNQHLYRSLSQVANVTQVSTFAIRDRISIRLGQLSSRLKGKHRLAIAVAGLWIACKYAFSRAHVIIDWESIGDVQWLIYFRRICSRPSVGLIFHLEQWTEASPENKIKTARKLRIFSRIITISEFSKRQLVDAGYRGPIEIMSPGVDDRCAMKPNRQSPPPSMTERRAPLRLLFIGNVIQRKGLSTLIDAITRIERGAVELYIVGSTANADFLRDLQHKTNNAKLSQFVHFVGRVSDEEKQIQLQSADVFVFPSVMEGYGIAAAEAVSASLPVIACDAGAMPELVHDGINGILVNPGCADSLAEAILSLIRSPEIIAKYRKGAIDLAESLQTWEEFENEARHRVIHLLS